jgi:hypothetical protein
MDFSAAQLRLQTLLAAILSAQRSKVSSELPFALGSGEWRGRPGPERRVLRVPTCQLTLRGSCISKKKRKGSLLLFRQCFKMLVEGYVAETVGW